jgi:hypothetical protein
MYDVCLKTVSEVALVAALAPFNLTATDMQGKTVLKTSGPGHALAYIGRVVASPAVIDMETMAVTTEATYHDGEYAVLRAEESFLKQIMAASLDGVEVLADPPSGLGGFGGGWRRPPPGPTLDQAQSAALAAIRAACDAALSPITAQYPDREVQSWPQQIAEATALASDPAAPAPLLRQMAAMRPSLGDALDERVAELARRILANAAAWSALAGPIIGRRQALDDQVMAAVTPEVVAAVVIDLGGAA